MAKPSTGKSTAVRRDRSRPGGFLAERHHPRFPATLPVRCSLVTGPTPRSWRGRTANVSGGGLAVELSSRLPPGTRVAIEIRTGIGPLRMEADVLWTRKAAGGDGATRHGLCLAGGSEVLDLPIHVLLGQWLQTVARREKKRPQEARTRGPRDGRQKSRS